MIDSRRSGAGSIRDDGLVTAGGVGAFNPDPTVQSGALTLPVQEAVLGRDGLIVENLRGLTGLPVRVRAGIFPLPFAAADAAPARVVAWVPAS